MHLVKSPLRVSYVGGGTDYRDYFNRFKDAGVIAAAIDQHVYLYSHSLSEIATENLRFTYRDTESVLDARDFKHPVMREMLIYLNWRSRTNFGTFADLPSGVGLGGSSAFTVALAKLLLEEKGEKPTADDLANIAIRIEREVLKEPGGIQDQYISAYGGLREFKFDKEAITASEPLLNSSQLCYLESRQILIWLGETRNSANHASHTISQINGRNHALRATAELFQKTSEQIKSSKDEEHSFLTLKSAVSEGWKLKKRFTTVPDKNLKRIESFIVNQKGAAMKLCGAGGGGFVLVLADPDQIEEIQNELCDYKVLQPRIDTEGCRTVANQA